MVDDDSKKVERRERHKAIRAIGRARLDERVRSLYDVYDDLNEELFELVETIRETQPRKPGAVLLELYKCGPSGCIGCPHIRWQKWVTRRASRPDKKPYWFATNITQPRRHARTNTIPDETREAIAQAEAVLLKRKQVMKHLSSLSRTVAAIEKHRFGDEGEGDQYDESGVD